MSDILGLESNKLASNNLHGVFKHNIQYAMIYSYALHIVLLYTKYAAVDGELKKGGKQRKVEINPFEARERKWKNQKQSWHLPLYFDQFCSD